MGEKLNLLDRFPEISLTDTEGGTIRIAGGHRPGS